MDRETASPTTKRDLAVELIVLDRTLKSLDIRDIARAEAILARIDDDRRILRFWARQSGENADYHL
jgi:hypothetical protein